MCIGRHYLEVLSLMESEETYRHARSKWIACRLTLAKQTKGCHHNFVVRPLARYVYHIVDLAATMS